MSIFFEILLALKTCRSDSIGKRLVLALFGWNWLRAHVPAAACMEASVVFKETVLWFTTLGRQDAVSGRPAFAEKL